MKPKARMKADQAFDKKMGIKENSKKDKAMDKLDGVAKMEKKAMKKRGKK